MKTFLISLLLVILLFFCYDCQELEITPSPIAFVTIGKPLTLTCNYTGSNTPFIYRWFLGNDTTGMSVSKATCTILGTPGAAYEVSRYAINCFQLTITNITWNDIDDHWGCTVDFTLGTSPNVSNTVIKIAVPTTTPSPPPTDTTITMITASTTILTAKAQTGTTANITSTSSGTTANITSTSSGTTANITTSSGTTENLTTSSCTPPVIVMIGVSFSGFLFILVIIIIIICCCRLYCYKKERYISEQCRNGTELKQNYNETATNYTAEDATSNPAYGLSNILSVSSTSDEFPTKMHDLKKNKNSESESNKLTKNAPFHIHASEENKPTNTFNQDWKDKHEVDESKKGKEEITNL